MGEDEEPNCAQCGKLTRGKYGNCGWCGIVLCDACDVRNGAETPRCHKHEAVSFLMTFGREPIVPVTEIPTSENDREAYKSINRLIDQLIHAMAKAPQMDHYNGHTAMLSVERDGTLRIRPFKAIW